MTQQRCDIFRRRWVKNEIPGEHFEQIFLRTSENLKFYPNFQREKIRLIGWCSQKRILPLQRNMFTGEKKV